MPTVKQEAPQQPGVLLSIRTSLACVLGIVVVLFAVYCRSLKFEFVLDDHRFTTDPRIQEPGHVWDYFANFVWAQFKGGPPSFYRPVFLLWMRLNFILSGASPWGWHLLSIAKHTLVAILLGLLAWRLLRDWRAALVAATLFALHPAHVESVSWATVPDPLMSIGILGALLSYFRYVDASSVAEQPPNKKSRKHVASSSAQRPAIWLGASVALYFGALLAKETAIVFPVVILALELLVPGKAIPLKDRFRQALWRLAPFAGVSGVYLFLRWNALNGSLGAATQHLPLGTIAMSWPATLWFYVKVLLWPVKSYAFADPTVVETFSLKGVLVPMIENGCAALMLAAGLFWGWKTARKAFNDQQARRLQCALVVGTLLLVPPLVLALNLNALNPGDFLHGRYTYLPLVGLMLLVGTWYRMMTRSSMLFLGAACLLVVAFAAQTFSLEKQWRNDTTVFTIAHELAPRNGPVARNLADTHVQAALRLNEEGRCSEGMPILEQVIREYPEDWYAWAAQGDCYVQLNELTKAEGSFHRAAELSKDNRVIEQWQELRAHMGLSSSVPAN